MGDRVGVCVYDPENIWKDYDKAIAARFPLYDVRVREGREKEKEGAEKVKEKEIVMPQLEVLFGTPSDFAGDTASVFNMYSLALPFPRCRSFRSFPSFPPPPRVVFCFLSGTQE
jgi:hypothetical protein